MVPPNPISNLEVKQASVPSCTAFKCGNLGKLSSFIFSDLGSKKKTVTVVDGVKHYKSVRDYLQKESLKKCLPWAKSLAEGIGIYYGIADDWEERIMKGGIFAIRIHPEKPKVRQ